MVRDAWILVLGLAIASSGLIHFRGRGSRWPARVAKSADHHVPHDDLRDQFLATISHELRTPLNAIIGWAQLLRSGRLSSSDMSHAIQAIDRNARLEAELINSLLDVSRMKQARPRVRREPVALDRVVDDIVGSLREEARCREVALSCHRAAAEITVVGDAARLSQLVYQLVANALKFTPKGGHVDVYLAPQGAYAELVVADDGIGMTNEDLPHVFEPFYQARSHGPRRGLGLGLAMVDELVRLHHGSVRIESPGENAGSRVLVHLPLSRGVRRSEGDTPAPAEPRTANGD